MNKYFSYDEVKVMLNNGSAKHIDGFKDYIIVSSGVVISLKNRRFGKYCCIGNKTLSNEYASVSLSQDGKLSKIAIHKLVAISFVPNPCGYKEINHIDENKSNNSVDNLEWVDHTTNMRHGSRTKRATESRKRAVAQVENGEIIAIYESAVDACSHGFVPSGITACARGKLNQYKGFDWIYLSNNFADHR